MTTHRRKLLLIKLDVKKHECEICKNSVWNELPIPIELHHRDGNNKNNDITNLSIICPNCHAQTENYKSKNRSTAKHCSNLDEGELISLINRSFSISEVLRTLNVTRSMYVREWCKRLLKEFKATLLIKPKAIKIKIKKDRKQKITSFCKDCNCEIYSSKATTIRCKSCHFKYIENPNRPSIDVLVEDIKNLGYVKTGKKYGVSDNGIRKWVKFYGKNPNDIKFLNR